MCLNRSNQGSFARSGPGTWAKLGAFDSSGTERHMGQEDTKCLCSLYICLSVPQQPWSKICGLYFTKRTACILYMPLLDPFLSITKTFNKISLFSMIVGVSTWNQPFEPRSRGASWAIRQDARLSSVGGRLIGGEITWQHEDYTRKNGDL